MKQLIIATLLCSALPTQAIAAKPIPAAAAPAAASAPATPAAPARTVVAAATPAPARTTPARAAAPSYNSGLYLGAQVGDSTVGALLGYQFSRMYAMEVSYDYMDPVYTPTTTLEKSRAGVAGLAMFPLKFSEMGPMALYIKVGYARTTEKLTVNDPGLGIPGFPATTTVTTTLKTGVTAGAGVQVDLSNSSTARLGVNYVGGDRSVYLAALYRF